MFVLSICGFPDVFPFRPTSYSRPARSKRYELIKKVIHKNYRFISLTFTCEIKPDFTSLLVGRQDLSLPFEIDGGQGHNYDKGKPQI